MEFDSNELGVWAWILVVIGVILFIYIVTVGDRGHEFEVDNTYENGGNPTPASFSEYPANLQNVPR